MKSFKNIITLNKNSRGCYIVDTVKGCRICSTKPRGCYDDCYAHNIAFRYRIDFNNPVLRSFITDRTQLYFMNFHDEKHESEIVRQIKKIDMPFIRIGEMGDPSENWEHTINVCRVLSLAKKPIVIITKHWNTLKDSMLRDVEKLGLYINTSISALDSDSEIEHRFNQFNRLKKHCNSILRIVSCDFNCKNKEGIKRRETQEKLFQNDNILDTVFRPSVTNRLVTEGVINVKKVKFLRANVLASVYNNNAYLGDCLHCPDMCGIRGIA